MLGIVELLSLLCTIYVVTRVRLGAHQGQNLTTIDTLPPTKKK